MRVAMARLGDGQVPIDDNWVEEHFRPIALGRQNWLFASSLHDSRRAAAPTCLIHSAKLNEIDPCSDIRDLLEELSTQPASRIAELLPHRRRACPSN
jgi:hypothetical protein